MSVTTHDVLKNLLCSGLLRLPARCLGPAFDEVCLHSTEGFSEKELSLWAQSRGGGYKFPSQRRRGNGFRDGCHTDPFHCPAPPLISTNPRPLAFQSLNFALPVPFSSFLPVFPLRTDTWKWSGSSTLHWKDVQLSPGPRFYALHQLLFLSALIPLFFLNCFHVKELRWQTKHRVSPHFHSALLLASWSAASFHFHWIRLRRSRGNETKGKLSSTSACASAWQSWSWCTSCLLPARPLSNEAGSLTACKAATVQPLHTCPPLGPQHFHRGTLARF